MQAPVRNVIMRLCRVYQVLYAKVWDPALYSQFRLFTIQVLCDLERYFPPAFFDIMTHLTVHLVDEVQLYGPLGARTCYSQERFINVLKGHVRNCCTPKASISLGYIAEETLGYLTEYMSLYGPVTTRIWDADEEMGSYSEVLEGASRRVKWSAEEINMAHDYVLRNTESLLLWVRSVFKYPPCL